LSVLTSKMQSPGAGQILAGKYRLIHQLGKGGMGTVWSAQHIELKSLIAIKLTDNGIPKSTDARTRFLREARAAAALRSPHVVQILDYGVDEGVPFIAMELLEGESLADRLERVGSLSPAQTARILTHVARAMARAHDTGIVHRDLKPANVFLVPNDGEEIAKVLDFGIARTPVGLDATTSARTATGDVFGTPCYMSPEQAEGETSLDHRTDIWSMGVIAFECLLGQRPFQSKTTAGLVLAICTRPLPVPSQAGPVPTGFDGWFARACARDPDQRFPSAQEAAAELRIACGERVSSSAADAPRAAGEKEGPLAHRASPMMLSSDVPTQSTGGLSATHRKGARRSQPSVARARRFALAAVLGALAAGGTWGLARLAAKRAMVPSSTDASAGGAAPVQDSAQSAPAEATAATEPAATINAGSVPRPETSVGRVTAVPSGRAGATAPRSRVRPPAQASAGASAAPPPSSSAPPKVNLGI
jgi:serine/threonine-protein kinase